MITNEFILMDRVQKIKQIIIQYGEENFYLSFSGGKDSTVLSALVDMAIPDNKIPRVYADTGIELNIVRDFVRKKASFDKRFIIIKPTVPIKKMLEKFGYPFKSKHHSHMLSLYQNNHDDLIAIKYKNGEYRYSTNQCPKCLRYQFEPDFNLKVSDTCCFKLKEEPLFNWQNENNKPYAILGLMRDEGGRRDNAKCLAFKSGGRFNFQPLVMVSKAWEEWFIKEYDVSICDIYKEPYNFERTGCKGCPFNIRIQEGLDTLDKYFPSERKQCEIIWKPVYDEYRRLGYRLKNNSYEQVELEGYLKGLEMEE